MSKKYPAGVITKSPVTPTGPYQDGVASGVWSMEQMEYWMKQGLWPVAGNANPGDPYFDYVTMLLNGNGTNGAQNNTFVDSSTNNFTITRNGNTTQGSFSPYGSLWSNYFNGSSNFVYANNSAFQLGTSDFTVEFWIQGYPYNENRGIVCFRDSGGAWGTGAYLIIDAGDGIAWYTPAGFVVTATMSSAQAAQWNHIAFVRSSGTIKAYLNGVAVSTASDTTSYNGNGSPQFRLGSNYDESGEHYFTGTVSNFRITKSAVYTSNFTPSTTPLTAISNTTFLICQSNRFVDNSSSALSVQTINGTPSVQRFSPFNPTASYSTATIGGSGYFDGSGDYLTVGTASALQFGTGDFTIEFWLYGQTSGRQDWFEMPGTNRIQFLYEGTNVGVYINSSFVVGGNVGQPPLNAWNHFAYTRSSGTNRVFMNGVQVGSNASNSTNFTDNSVVIAYTSGGQYTKGYFSDVRLLKGTALYTTTFTPPTSPETAISNTSLLCNMTNAGIPDSAMMNDLETVGNAQVSTSVKKFGTGSIAFDGSGDYLQIKDVTTSFLNWSSNDYTVEYWIYANSFTQGSNNESVIIGNTDPSAGTNYWTFGPVTNGTVKFYYYSGSVQSFSTTTTLSTGQWYHLAFVNYGGALSIYINGVSSATATISGTPQYSTSYPLAIGASGGASFNGYIDDLRITKGYARYTANFTPPTAAFYTY